MNKDEIYILIKGAKRKKLFFGQKLLYKPIPNLPKLSEAVLNKLELGKGFKFPSTVKSALLSLGACEINGLYIHDIESIYPFDENNGKMSGFVTFASDDSGNFFAFDPNAINPDEIFYYSHDPLGWAIVAPNFLIYLKLVIDADFNTLAVTDNLELNDIN